MQQHRSGFLGHDLTIGEHGVFKPISGPRIGVGPRNIFLNAAMGRANDFSGEIAQLDLTAVQGQVAPYTALLALMFNFATSVAKWTSASVFIGFYKKLQPFRVLLNNKSGNR